MGGTRERAGVEGSRSRLAVLGAAFVAAVFIAGAAAVPVLRAAAPEAGDWLHRLYAPLCHQMGERSLSVMGGPMAVCARCAGLYAGGALGLCLAGLFWLGRVHALRPAWFFLALAPSMVDFVSPWIGLPGLPNQPRFLVAIPAGFTAALFLAVGLGDLFATRPATPAVQVPSPEPLEVLDA